jgi:thymidylate kinase
MLHSLVEAAFLALEQAGVRWCLLRLPSNPAAPTGDVDLLIDPAESGRVRQALEALGFARFPGRGSGAEFVYLSYHPATDCWIRLHLVTELSFGPRHAFKTGAAAGCLARRQREGVLVRPAAGDAFWVTLLHCLLDKGTVADRHRTALQDLAAAARPDDALGLAVERACPAGWSAARLVSGVKQGDWDGLERLAPSLAAAWWRHEPLAARLGRLLRAGLGLPAALLNRRRRRGLSVALLGPDGAGKSTLAAGVARSFFAPVRTVYMGFGVSGGTSRPPLLARLRVPGLGAPGRLFVLWWQFLKARYHQARGRLVIFDRYTYDALAPPPRRRGRLQRLSSWVKAHSCPAPNLVVVLDVPGPVMYQRKGDLSPEVLEAQRQRFRELGQRIPRVQVVDATRPPDAVRVDVVDRLWQLYAARWRKPRPA